MRKLLVVIVITLLSLSAVFAMDTGRYPFSISGVVRSDVVFLITIFEDAIPFDLDSSLVSYNPSYTSLATGIRIGQYTLVSRNPSIKLCVEHTPLVHSDSTILEHNQINYRLYLVTSDGSQGFFSTRGDQIEILGSTISTVIGEGNDTTEVVSLIDEFIYVTLDEGSESATEAVRTELESGIYQSTITFSVWVQT